MALNKQKLDPTGSGSKGAGCMAIYDAGADVLATVETAGYFNGAAKELAQSVAMIVAYANNTRKMYGVSIAAGVVTIAAIL